jgi:hypothetical protein
VQWIPYSIAMLVLVAATVIVMAIITNSGDGGGDAY